MADSPSTELDSIARDLSIPLEQVQKVAKLLDEGNTPAFITRFRREASGGMNEARILEVKRRLNLQRSLAERKSIVLKSIETQGKLSDELAAAIQAASTSKQLEDLYLPHKPKKQSLGQIARQRGLDPLATDIFLGTASDLDLAARATDYVRVDKGLTSIDEVFKGVGHLIAERFADDVPFRSRLREVLWKTGRIVTRKVETPESTEPNAAGLPTEDAAAPSTDSAPATDANAAQPQPEQGAEQPPPEQGAQIAAALPAEAIPTEAVGETAGASEPNTGDGSATSPDANTATSLTDQNDSVASPAAASAADAADRKKRRRKKKVHEHDPFKDYADFSESLGRLPPYRILAINRAERAKRIRVKTKIDDGQYTELVKSLVPAEHAFADFIEKCAHDAVQRLVLPSLDREVRRELTESAEQHALKVFGRNLRHLLLKPPTRGRRIVAIDPGFRYGCHAAALDEFGKVLGHAVFHVVGNEQRRTEGRQKLAELISVHHAQLIAIGNGSACRQTEQLVSDLINTELAERNLEYVIVNEAGTNAYASSEVGREELPHCEQAVRCAVSIGRRVLEPLSELVKVDPAHLGIGLYQHDIKAKHLAHELDEVVASCVNYVGVDVNSASPSLLSYVSGLGPLAARRLYEFRLQHGPFRNRQQFKEVAGIGEQTFVQAAGFLRIVDGDNPLDATMIHPESYDVATKILQKAGFQPSDLVPRKLAEPKPVEVPAAETPTESIEGGAAPQPNVASVETESPEDVYRRRGQLRDALYKFDRQQFASELGISPLELGDLIHLLLQAGIDPRERLPGAVFRRGIIKLENLEPQMQLRAQVVNVVDFGVFVDIGLGESSLIHISRLSDGFVSDPHLMFAVGDTLDVWVTQIDTQRRRVTLTAVRPGSEKTGTRGPRRARPGRRDAARSEKPAGPRRERKPFPSKPRRAEAPRRIHKPPRPVTPITKEMAEGKAPMRSFSDLAQFFTQRTEPPKEG